MMSLTQIAEIAAETAQKTLEDLEDVTEGLKVFAEALMIVNQTLQSDPEIIDAAPRSRSLLVNRLAGDIMQGITARYTTPSGTIDEGDRDPFREREGA